MSGFNVLVGRPAAVLVVCAVTACGLGTASSNAGGVSSNGRGTVVSGIALEDGQGSVLDAIRGKVPNLKIQRFVNECPRIALRNDNTFGTPVAPHVYVDGTRATDTCILETLRSGDVERVEVYPSGVSGRAGYPTHAHGLILLFMRT